MLNSSPHQSESVVKPRFLHFVNSRQAIMNRGSGCSRGTVNNSIMKGRLLARNEFFRERGGVLREADMRLPFQMSSLRPVAPSNVACSDGNGLGPIWAEFRFW